MARQKTDSGHRTILNGQTAEILKDIVGWVIVTAAAFVYWMLMLLFASLVLLSYWKVSFEQLLRYGIILTVISSVVYLVYLIRRKVKENRIARYMAD